MRVLVTGAAGFLGREVCLALAASGHEVVASGHNAECPVDFRLIELVAELFREAEPEGVVHLAGTSRPEELGGGPVELQSENIVHPLLNVLECAGSRRVLHVSSAAVYGAGPTDEAGPLRPDDLYGAARASAEALARRRAARFAQNFLIVRPFFLFGPEMQPSSEIAGWFSNRAAGGPIAAAGLHEPRDLLDVRDAARGVVTVFEGGESGQACNLTSGTTLTARALLDRLFPGEAVVEAPAPTRRAARARIGTSPAARALGWAPRISLEETLASVSLRAPRGRA